MKKATDKLKKDSMYKTKAKLPVQAISPAKTVKSADGHEYSLDAINPFSIRASGFKATVDGAEIVAASQLWSGTDNGASIILVKDENNEVSYIHIQDEQSETMIVSLDVPGTKRSETMVTITPDDFDYEAMNKIFHYDHSEEQDDGDRRALTTADLDDPSTGRALQVACSSFRVIEIAIAYDSSFCAQYRSASAAQSQVEAIVALASQRYEVPGLCTTLKISTIDGYCDASKDIYRNVIRNNNLFNIFKNHWNANEEDRPRGDVVHFFSGTDFSSNSVIGKAILRSVCRLSVAYGVNWITFSSDLTMQANLFAHELGHNAGADHYRGGSNTGHIMNDELNSGRNGFSSASISSMNTYLGSQNCLSSSGGGGGGGGTFGNNCGINWADADKCHTPCPNGVDSECPWGERCYAAITCS
jgi:hypothetical protein